jgi:hypothetical protein
MHESIADNSVVTGLYWLALILTGCEAISVNVTAEVLSTKSGNLRRAVVAQSVAAKESELRWARDRYQRQAEYGLESELRMGLDTMPEFFEVRDALLAVDLFPRHALLLTVFEGFSVRDAARCLDANEQSIRDGRGDGLVALAQNMTPVLSL